MGRGAPVGPGERGTGLGVRAGLRVDWWVGMRGEAPGWLAGWLVHGDGSAGPQMAV